MPDFNYLRIRPFDLLQVTNDQGSDTTLADAIAAIQENQGVSYDCPNCKVNGVPTGLVTIPPGIETVCPVCNGYLKTNAPYVPYMPNPLQPGSYVPLIIGGGNTLAAKATLQLTASVPGGQWRSSASNIASVVSGSGLVTGEIAGEATITYTFAGVNATLLITVTAQ